MNRVSFFFFFFFLTEQWEVGKDFKLRRAWSGLHFTKNTQTAILRRNGTEEEELKGCCDHQGGRLVAQTRILVIKVEKA